MYGKESEFAYCRAKDRYQRPMTRRSHVHESGIVRDDDVDIFQGRRCLHDRKLAGKVDHPFRSNGRADRRSDRSGRLTVLRAAEQQDHSVC